MRAWRSAARAARQQVMERRRVDLVGTSRVAAAAVASRPRSAPRRVRNARDRAVRPPRPAGAGDHGTKAHARAIMRNARLRAKRHARRSSRRRLTDRSGRSCDSRARGQPDLQRGPRLEPQRRRQSRVRRERDGRRRWLVWRVRRHGRRPKSNRPGRAAASRAGRAAAGRPREPDHARRRRRDALGARQWRQVLRRGRACDEAAAQAVAGIQAGRLRGAAAQGAAAQGAAEPAKEGFDTVGAIASIRRCLSRPACRAAAFG